jgi:chaperonin GroEL
VGTSQSCYEHEEGGRDGQRVQPEAAGGLDPAKVTRSAVQNAASVAALLLSTECAIVEKPEGEVPGSSGNGHRR